MGAILVLVVFLGIGVVVLVPARTLIAAWSAGVPVRLMDITAMRLRRVPPDTIIRPLVRAAGRTQ